MAGGLLSTGISGLNASQRSLDTTSHNIANVNTPGYSRQRVELAPRDALFAGGYAIGQGVDVDGIKRNLDEFVNGQVRSSTSTFGNLDRYHQYASQVDNLIANPDTGVAPAMKGFFGAVNDLANDPSSVPARQVLLSEAGSLNQTFHTVDARLGELGEQVNQDIKTNVKEINSMAKSLAEINAQVMQVSGPGNDRKIANDLLDKRDQLLKELSQKIDVATLEQNDGSVSVFIGQGQALVMAGTAQQLTAKTSELNPQKHDIHMVTSTGTQDITSQLSGGELAGTIRFKNEVLDPAQREIGLLAAGLAMEFNARHEQGFDLDGNGPGQSFFDFGANAVAVSSASTTVGAIDVQFDDANINPDASGQLDASDYELAFDGGNYTLTRMDDQTVINLSPSAGQLVATAPNHLPGISINISSALTNGDRFLIRPAYSAAQNINLAISDPRKVAAASAANVPGDNTIALGLADLETDTKLLNGKSSLQDVYNQTVSKVGSLTRSAEVGKTAQQALLNQAQDARENIAGVNLDEEAADLIKFQQSYQAAAQVISVASSLFDTLIGAVRR